ncbi:MAG: hypothetical protein ABR947_07645 [Solirubrobacteraceae bacterium]
MLALACAGVAVAAPLGGPRRVVGNCDHSQIRPSTIWISCNNPSLSFMKLRWSAFGGPTARAVGVIRLESCPSACDPHAVRDYPVVVVASQARRCPDGHDDYRLLDVTYRSSARPPDTPAKTPPLVLFCPLAN